MRALSAVIAAFTPPSRTRSADVVGADVAIANSEPPDRRQHRRRGDRRRPRVPALQQGPRRQEPVRPLRRDREEDHAAHQGGEAPMTSGPQATRCPTIVAATTNSTIDSMRTTTPGAWIGTFRTRDVRHRHEHRDQEDGGEDPGEAEDTAPSHKLRDDSAHGRTHRLPHTDRGRPRGERGGALGRPQRGQRPLHARWERRTGDPLDRTQHDGASQGSSRRLRRAGRLTAGPAPPRRRGWRAKRSHSQPASGTKTAIATV